MENSGAPCSLASDSQGSCNQSQWLQVTLSDMNKRMRAMMTLLEEDDNSLSRSNIYSRKRLELIQMIEEFSKSYCCLAEEYDQLRLKLHQVSSSSNTENKGLVGSSHDPTLEIFDSGPESIVGDTDVECDNNNVDFEYLNKLADELMSTESCKENQVLCQIEENQVDDQVADSSNKDDINEYNFYQATVGENTWPELKFQVTKLMEENLRQQAELARRNIEKRMIINKLQVELQNLKGQNRDLQNCISCLKVEEKSNQSHATKLRALFSGKFFRAGCS